MVPDDPAYRLAPGEAIIGEGIARTRGFKTGGALLLVSQTGKLLKARIRETFSNESALVSSDLVLISEADYRKFFNLAPNLYTDIAVSIRNEREIGTVIKKATLAMPEARFVTRSDIYCLTFSLYFLPN